MKSFKNLIQNVLIFLYKFFYAFTGLYILKKRPVIIYSNGHSGSMSLLQSLRAAGVFAFKIELVSTLEKHHEVPRSTYFVKKCIIDQNIPSDYIILVRNPVTLTVSWYFSKLKHIPEAVRACQENDVPQLQKIFLNNFFPQAIEKNLLWFENEFEKTFNLDIYKKNFNSNHGYSLLDIENNTRILIMRTELENSNKEKILTEYLKPSNEIKLTNYNNRASKSNAHLYPEFKKTLQFEESVLNKILESKYSKQFLSEQEIIETRERWVGITN